MTWGNRNPQPKENNMDEQTKVAYRMLDYAIQQARNEGFAEGVDWQKRVVTPQPDLVTFSPKDRCESSCYETNGPTIKEYNNDGRYQEYNDAVWPGEEE